MKMSVTRRPTRISDQSLGRYLTKPQTRRAPHCHPDRFQPGPPQFVVQKASDHIRLSLGGFETKGAPQRELAGHPPDLLWEWNQPQVIGIAASRQGRADRQR